MRFKTIKLHPPWKKFHVSNKKRNIFLIIAVAKERNPDYRRIFEKKRKMRRRRRRRTHQKDLDGSQDVHGSREGGAQVEAQAHRPPELRTQRAADHEVGASRWRRKRRRRERESEREREREREWERESESGAGCTSGLKEVKCEERKGRNEMRRWDVKRERERWMLVRLWC